MYPSNGQWILYLLIPWWRSIRHKQTGLPFCLIGLLESLFNGKMYDSNWSPFFHENVQFFQFTIWFWRLWQISQISLILGKVFWFISWLLFCKTFVTIWEVAHAIHNFGKLEIFFMKYLVSKALVSGSVCEIFQILHQSASTTIMSHRIKGSCWLWTPSRKDFPIYLNRFWSILGLQTTSGKCFSICLSICHVASAA